MNYFNFQPMGLDKSCVNAYLQTIGKSVGMIERKMPAVVICPGGAYQMVSDSEGDPVAKEFLSAGYHLFVLNYSTGEEAANFNPLCQLASTVAQIRTHAEEWKIDENKIAVCGFSAGGHLEVSLGTLFNEEKFLEVWKRAENVRPDAMILCYPVILADEYAHQESIETVSGAKKECLSMNGLDWISMWMKRHRRHFYGIQKQIFVSVWKIAFLLQQRYRHPKYPLSFMYCQRGSMGCLYVPRKQDVWTHITEDGLNGVLNG